MTVVRHRDTPLDGTAPLLLYGYGAYEATEEPDWDPALPSLLDRGAVFAHAHVRGGGEGGRRWWLDGRLEHKQHTFTDFVAVADAMAGRYVDGSRIVSRGLSAGGLLQGAVFSQRPDRWRAVVAEVPFVDVVTTMFDATIPLTITEWDEWGDPRRRADFDWMLAYSPYDNPPPAGSRPDLLVTGAVHDPRVMVREPAKWVARLRETDPEWSPRCQFRVETGAGAHTGPSGRFGHLAYEAEVHAWVLDRHGPVVIPLHEEVLEVARALIRFDTSNAPEAALGRPPGDETGPAAYLRDLLTGAGVDCELVARDPRRANLVARIPGSDPSAPLAGVRRSPRRGPGRPA